MICISRRTELHLAAIELTDILSLENDLAGRALDQAQQQTSRSGLAAAAFPHQTNGFTPVQRKRDPIDRLYVSDGAG